MLLSVAIIPTSDASRLLVPRDPLTSIAVKLVKTKVLFLIQKGSALQIENKTPGVSFSLLFHEIFFKIIEFLSFVWIL